MPDLRIATRQLQALVEQIPACHAIALAARLHDKLSSTMADVSAAHLSTFELAGSPSNEGCRRFIPLHTGDLFPYTP